ncbi:MAG TPA: adenylosuccinate lyase [Chlamydiales bacterium]
MNEYLSPLSTRYGSREMSALFSDRHKIETFRKLWVALATAQRQLGLPISDLQIKQLEAHITHIDLDAIHRYEKKFRHDVMAHIHAFGDLCPDAKPILHLGATSSYVTDNAELIQLKEALSLLLQKLLHLLEKFSTLANKHASDPCLGFTHFQPAQPTTIGKRICLWLQDFFWDAQEWHRLLENIPFLGVKGATGTQSSFLALFQGDSRKVVDLEKKIAAHFGFTRLFSIAGQTYSRKLDVTVLNALASFAASAHKWATDFRLLAHEGEFFEPFSETQVGSSAMPYKRNPIYTERVCGLARFMISLSQNPLYTTATQWLERSLDDSSNRRLVLPEAFLSIDAILNLMAHVLERPDIRVEKALSQVEEKLPFLCMENILMEAVKRGASRQEAHEVLRKLSFQTFNRRELTQQLEKEFGLTQKEIESIINIKLLIGRAPEQVHEFLAQEVNPFLRNHPVDNVTFASVEL